MSAQEPPGPNAALLETLRERGMLVDPLAMTTLQEAVEDLAALVLPARPTFAVPWTDGVNATPTRDVRAVIEGARRADPSLYDVDRLDEGPSHSFVRELRNVVWQADQIHDPQGGDTRHWVRDAFLPALREAGYEIVRRRDA